MDQDSILSVQKIPGSELSIAIRKLTINDINNRYCSWLNDSNVNRYLESRFTAWDIDLLKEYFYEKNKSDIMLAIVDYGTNAHIGNIKITPIENPQNRAAIGIIIGDRNYWKKGVATIAIKMATDYCFTTLALHKVIAGAYIENIASIKAFLNNGFIIEGEHSLTLPGRISAILLGKTNKE